jgi:guanine deaminase
VCAVQCAVSVEASSSTGVASDAAVAVVSSHSIGSGLRVALAIEKMRANSGGPFGAVIVRNNTIISEGWNEVTSSNDPTAHAEIVAIRRACALLGAFNLPDCDIYTSCEPCPMCLGAIYWARLRRVYYANSRAEASQIGFDDGFIYGEVARVPELRKIPHFRLMTDDAQVAFKEWAASLEKIRY